MTTKMEIQKLINQDIDKLRELLLVFKDVFEQPDFKMPPENYLVALLSKQEHLVFVAILDNKVIGGLTAYILNEYGAETSIVYIYDLAVSKMYQRKGIGQKLIAEINTYCRSKNISEVFIQADAGDGYAVDFYRKTQGKEMKVVQFTYELGSVSD